MNIWTNQWPTKAGYYLFYGWMSSYQREHHDPEIILVHFPWNNMKRVDYCISGLYPDMVIGVWQQLESVPIPPVREIFEAMIAELPLKKI